MKRDVQKNRATQRKLFFVIFRVSVLQYRIKKIVRKRKSKVGLQQVTLKVDKIANTWTVITRLTQRSYEHEKHSNAVIRIWNSNATTHTHAHVQYHCTKRWIHMVTVVVSNWCNVTTKLCKYLHPINIQGLNVMFCWPCTSIYLCKEKPTWCTTYF